MDSYRRRPIFYSLGNFVWPDLSVEGSTTAVAEVTVTPGGALRGRLLPASITAPGHPEAPVRGPVGPASSLVGLGTA